MPVLINEKNDNKTLISESSIMCGYSLLSSKHLDTKLSFLLMNFQSLIKFSSFPLNKNVSKTSQQTSIDFLLSSILRISGSVFSYQYKLKIIFIEGTILSVMQIIPHQDTVARVAYLRVCTSNKILTFSGMTSHSPFGKVRVLLSSKTEFKFSTHSGSMSPSKTIQ